MEGFMFEGAVEKVQDYRSVASQDSIEWSSRQIPRIKTWRRCKDNTQKWNSRCVCDLSDSNLTIII
jgi:hypothetical protein